MSQNTMPAGEYYVGDLCYVIPETYWAQVAAQVTSEVDTLNGIFTVDQQPYAIFTTAYGDGVYKDALDREYPVDSGTIGCISINSLTALNADAVVDKIQDLELGQVITFDSEFTCYSSDGTIHLGNVVIPTGNYADDQYEYEEQDIWN